MNSCTSQRDIGPTENPSYFSVPLRGRRSRGLRSPVETQNDLGGRGGGDSTAWNKQREGGDQKSAHLGVTKNYTL